MEGTGLSRTLPSTLQLGTFPRFGIACLAALVGLLISGSLHSFSGGLVYLMAVAAVAFSSAYCGTWPSILCTAISLLGVQLWFVRLTHPLGSAHSNEWFNTFAFLFSAAVIVALGEANRRQQSQLWREAGELEEKVRQRTSELDRRNQSLRELSARLLNLQDEERRRIARELHDNAGQALAALAINLNSVASDLGRLMETVHTVKDSASLVKQMSDDIRTTSYLLHPPLLDEMGLLSALEWYVQGFAERSKIAVEFDCAQKLGRFSREVEITAFRVVQECLTNILRHSGSPTAAVQIKHADSQLQVQVSDRGQGIPRDKQQQMESGGTVGVGIRGMRERIQQLGGSLTVTSDGDGTGTRVVVRLPAVETVSAQTPSSKVAYFKDAASAAGTKR
jgi:signal transduction histidine kinase